MWRYTLALLVVAVSAISTQAPSQQKRKSLTKEECDSIVTSVGTTPGRLRSMPFRKLHETEVVVLDCVKTYKLYAYSVADATISQFMLERCEDFIHERELDNDFFTWDEKLYGK
jgi:hypothetical protein